MMMRRASCRNVCVCVVMYHIWILCVVDGVCSYDLCDLSLGRKCYCRKCLSLSLCICVKNAKKAMPPRYKNGIDMLEHLKCSDVLNTNVQCSVFHIFYIIHCIQIIAPWMTRWRNGFFFTSVRRMLCFTFSLMYCTNATTTNSKQFLQK